MCVYIHTFIFMYIHVQKVCIICTCTFIHFLHGVLFSIIQMWLVYFNIHNFSCYYLFLHLDHPILLVCLCPVLSSTSNRRYRLNSSQLDRMQYEYLYYSSCTIHSFILAYIHVYIFVTVLISTSALIFPASNLVSLAFFHRWLSLILLSCITFIQIVRVIFSLNDNIHRVSFFLLLCVQFIC